MKVQKNKLTASAIIFSLFIIACKKNSSEVSGQHVKNDTITAIKDSTISKTAGAKFNIETFSEFPKEIDGCSCYYSNNEEEFKKNQYIFVNDYDKISFMKINGTMIKFVQKETKDIDANTTETKSFGNDYELTVKSVKGKASGDETNTQSGIIIVKDKSGNSVEKTFYGECGC